ncbi:MAG: tetratricopeptide repeat protein [Cytophagaceae bacterium]|jgi:tetratricopeptide (TPR) repeat protein|nr:tetratricopeptide repeat protein [Cytophagaceae bacterium]
MLVWSKFYRYLFGHCEKKHHAVGIFSFLTGMFLVTSFVMKGQSLVEKIESGARSTLNVTALNKAGMTAGSSMAFLISDDGLAITNATLLQNCDSIFFYDNGGKNFELIRIVACHQKGNLAMVHLKLPRSKSSDFLTPSRQPYAGDSETLAFVNSADSDAGLSYGKIAKVTHNVVGGRLSLVDVHGSATSNCAPVINNAGDFIGIYRFTGNRERGALLPVSYLSDTLWISVNQTFTEFKLNPQKALLTTPSFCEGLLLMTVGKWIEAARRFTAFLKHEPQNAQVYALRALCYFDYGDNAAGGTDVAQSLKLNPDGYLPHYARAVSYLNEKNLQKAMEELFATVNKYADFAEAFLEIGKLQSKNSDIQRAYASLSYALKNDSLLSEAWYERGRLSLLHSSNQAKALADLTMAARLNPSHKGVYTLMGAIKLQQNNYMDAILDFDKAISNDPSDIHALMNRGMAYYNIGRKENACTDWGDASKKGNTQAIRLLARYCSNSR